MLKFIKHCLSLCPEYCLFYVKIFFSYIKEIVLLCEVAYNMPITQLVAEMLCTKIEPIVKLNL